MPLYISKIRLSMEYDRMTGDVYFGGEMRTARRRGDDNMAKRPKRKWRWLVRRQGLKKEKEAGLRRIPLQPAA
jgi:hypothetical protein